MSALAWYICGMATPIVAAIVAVAAMLAVWHVREFIEHRRIERHYRDYQNRGK